MKVLRNKRTEQLITALKSTQQCDRQSSVTLCLEILHCKLQAFRKLPGNLGYKQSRDEAETASSKPYQAKSWVCDC